GKASEVLEQACKLGLEGLIGKDADAVYISGRSRSWIKLKCRLRQDFVIGGYTAPGGTRTGFGALLVGFYERAGKLQYAGKVGTGFDERLLQGMTRRLAALKKSDPPFDRPPKEKGVTWVRPSLVAQVAYAERTKDGILRQASFMGLREDLPASSGGEEQAQPPPAPAASGDNEVLGIGISHPDRLIWPQLEFSKIELARYVETVGERLLAHVKDRPLSLVRCPDGAEGKCFYQRHLVKGMKAKGAYMHADSLEAVVRAVQNGAIELHTWGATVPDIKHPDRITMDLDPDQKLPWKQLVEGTLLTKSLLEGLGLKSFLKTTGGKGLHIVAPLEPKLGWGEVKEFTRRIAGMLAEARPDLFTASMSKQRRKGRIFVDYLRNAETASAIAAFSPRARPNAGVSLPLAWEELDAKTDLRARFDVRSVLERLREDPWADYWTTRQSISAKIKKAIISLGP
ncbi:MAG: DNA ligase D, partial [Burkholderiales bacterium]